VHALLQASPFLAPFLLQRVHGFERLADARARTRWARVMTLNDVAVRLNVPWRQLVRDIATEVERRTGRPPRVADEPRQIAGDERRLGELRQIVAGLEAGGSLEEMAERWREATADLEQGEEAALEAALSAGRANGLRQAGLSGGLAAALAGEPLSPPAGHPLDLLRREAGVVRGLCRALAEALARLGGSPARRRWQQERALVVSLVGRLSTVERRFRREQQAWFPALRVHDVDGPQTVLRARQAEALEALRRLRLAVDRDDAASAAEWGARLVADLDELLALDDRLLEPLAGRHLSTGDWVAVRAIEDGVGWVLPEPPPPWPQV
jgi:hypothetical protein